MCLYVDKIKTEQMMRMDVPEWEFYKLYVRCGTILKTPYFQYKITGPGVHTLPGIVWQIRHKTAHESGVFHARIDRASHKADIVYAEYFSKDKLCFVSLPIIVKKEHIVAFGIHEDVGILTYEISQEVWEEAINPNSEYLCQ